MMQCRPS